MPRAQAVRNLAKSAACEQEQRPEDAPLRHQGRREPRHALVGAEPRVERALVRREGGGSQTTRSKRAPSDASASRTAKASPRRVPTSRPMARAPASASASAGAEPSTRSAEAAPRPGREAEAADMGEHVEDAAARREGCREGVVRPLVEEDAGLLPPMTSAM
jgi:hypothetical protein